MQEARGGRLAGDGIYSLEQVGLAGIARQCQSSVASIAGKGEMDLLSEGRARWHHALLGDSGGVDGWGYYANWRGKTAHFRKFAGLWLICKTRPMKTVRAFGSPFGSS